jgi:serine/threonine protein kinase
LHYRITEQLGSGGKGVVYRAHDQRLGRDVALKVLPTDVALDPERLVRFEREARYLAQLNHPNIATIHSVEEAAGVHFLTMRSRARRCRTSWPPACLLGTGFSIRPSFWLTRWSVCTAAASYTAT